MYKKNRSPKGLLPLSPSDLARAGGFTLVELVLVVIILAVILGLAVPNFKNSFSRLLLQQTASDLSYAMQYAQSRAIQNGLQEKLVFDEQRKTYVLHEERDDEETGEKEFAAPRGRWGRVRAVPGRITLEIVPDEINFFPDGKIDRLRVYVCQKNDCMTVSTREQTGYVDVYEGRLE